MFHNPLLLSSEGKMLEAGFSKLKINLKVKICALQKVLQTGE